MKKILLSFLLLFSVYSYSSEINGNVFLDNTSDHSGITIKFNPVSPSAVYTDGTSDTSGSYSISVINGIYDISYEKNGYQTYTLANQFISTDDSLPDVTLNSNTAVNVSGNVSGNWSNNNTYIVNGNITIPSGQILTIEQGTEIKFDGYYSLTVNGTLNANGTDNSHIIFTSNNNPASRGDWNKIIFNNSSQTSILNYCTVEYGNEDNLWDGMIKINGKANVTNSIIRETNGTGIGVSSSSTIIIENNEIYNSNWGITAASSGTFNIISNNVKNMSEGGILIRSGTVNTNVSKNIITNCIYRGISTFGMSTVSENIVYNINQYGIYVGRSEPNIINNTIFNTQHGIALSFSESANPKPIINSNIIANNSGYAIYSDGVPKPSNVSYNLFYNNTSGIGNNNLPVGTGTIVTTNNNSTDSDTYYNIFSSPNLSSTNPLDSDFCELNSNSDAINAGDPNITNNYNSTTIDIGAKESSEALNINKFLNNDFVVFPNPILNQVKIQARSNQLFDKIELYNIMGQIIKEFNLKNSNNEYSLKGLNNLESGIYIAHIYNKFKKIQLIKLIKK